MLHDLDVAISNANTLDDLRSMLLSVNHLYNIGLISYTAFDILKYRIGIRACILLLTQR